MRGLVAAVVVLTAACGPKRPPPSFAPEPVLVEQNSCRAADVRFAAHDAVRQDRAMHEHFESRTSGRQ